MKINSLRLGQLVLLYPKVFSIYYVFCKYLLIIFLLCTSSIPDVYGQNSEQLQKLKEIANKQAILFVQTKKRTLEKAYQLKIPVVKKNDDGGVMELKYFHGDHPIYIGNLLSKDSLQVYPSPAYNKGKQFYGFVYERNVSMDSCLTDNNINVHIAPGRLPTTFKLTFEGKSPHFIAVVDMGTGLLVYTSNNKYNKRKISLAHFEKGKYRMSFLYEKTILHRMLTVE